MCLECPLCNINHKSNINYVKKKKDDGVLARQDMKSSDADQLTWSAGCPGHTHLKRKHSPDSVFLVHRLIVRWVCVCMSTSTAGYTEHVTGQSLPLWDWKGDRNPSGMINLRVLFPKSTNFPVKNITLCSNAINQSEDLHFFASKKISLISIESPY